MEKNNEVSNTQNVAKDSSPEIIILDNSNGSAVLSSSASATNKANPEKKKIISIKSTTQSEGTKKIVKIPTSTSTLNKGASPKTSASHGNVSRSSTTNKSAASHRNFFSL